MAAIEPDPPSPRRLRREAAQDRTDQPPEPAGASPEGTDGEPTDEAAARRQLRAVWLAAGSAVAAMVAVTWYQIVHNGGVAVAGDMIGHAAAAEWLRTLPWWDWRGWSDWFYGGQAIGVNYPPLAHALPRFTHPTYGQMAAVTVALLVLLPWGTLRLARAVGFAPRAQRAAVGAVLVLVCLSGGANWLFPSFHQQPWYFGSWPVVVATALGMFSAAWAARCERPVACGVVAGVALLFNPTVMPGVAVVCVVLVATSGASLRRAVYWTVATVASALAVCAWWLVPFVAGSERLVRWEVPLAWAVSSSGTFQTVILAVVAVAAAWAYRSGSLPARRLAAAAAAGLLAALVADLSNWLRAERWLVLPIVVACAAAGALRIRGGPTQRPGRSWAVLGVALAIGFVVVTGRYEALPLVVWLLWWPRRTWVTAGALAWAGVLLFMPLWAQVRNPPTPATAPRDPMAIVAAQVGNGAAGLVYTDPLFNLPPGDAAGCPWGVPWQTTRSSGGDLRPLSGLYQETSHAAEFLDAESHLRGGTFTADGGLRPDWFGPWVELGGPTLATPAAAETFGARWYAACDPAGNVFVRDMPGVQATGVTVVPLPDEAGWHRAAVQWWVPIAAATTPGDGAWAVPMLSTGETKAHPLDQSATGVSLRADGDRVNVRAETPGWVWLRIPWDPDWRSLTGTPVRLGGPGHLLVWAESGETELRWAVAREVDVAAAAVTGAATLTAAVAVAAYRRREPGVGFTSPESPDGTGTPRRVDPPLP